MYIMLMCGICFVIFTSRVKMIENPMCVHVQHTFVLCAGKILRGGVDVRVDDHSGGG